MHNTTNSQYDDELLRPFKLGLVLVCPAKNQIQINEVTKKVQPKAMAVLAYLANHKDRVISSEELIEALWAGRIVTQSSVQKSINTIRKLLADHLPDQIVIENYSKKGYQLVLNPEFRQSTEMLIKADATPSLLKSYKVIATIVIFMIFSTFIGYLYTTDLSHFPERQHKTLFTKNQAMDAPVLNASFVLPHPINEDLLYSRNEILNKRESLQVLMIKGSQSLEEWRLASTKGVWVQSAWSENGRHLVAIEQQESNLQPLRSFYGQVPLLYTIHIFTLNLTTRTLEEKQLLSQWHGRINSVTWSNNESFEFVATQGENTTFQRFKYSPNVQTLELVEPTPTTQLATYSVAHGNLVALSSQRKNGSEIHFIDKRQQVKSSWAIDFKVSELSWIPDGSGVLISAAGLPKLTLLYLNGEQVNIPVDVSNIEQSLKARFSSDGQKIYYANNQSKGELILERIKDRTDETQAKVVTGELGILSQNGLGIIYVKRGSSGIQIRKIDINHEDEMILELKTKSFSNLIWVNENGLVYKSGAAIYYYDLKRQSNQRLLSDAQNITPIQYDLTDNKLIALVNVAQAENLWLIDLNKNSHKQLTFGAIGSSKLIKQQIYFQYIGQKGLWNLQPLSLKIVKTNSELPTNSKILSVDEEGSYFVKGSYCNESNIFYQLHSDEHANIYKTRENQQVNTIDFDPSIGTLIKQCSNNHTSINVLQ